MKKVEPKSPKLVMEALDSSPIKVSSAADEEWLRDLARKAHTDTLTLSFASVRELDASPLIYFDWQSSQWWAGRFVGEVTFQKRTLKILPRFGMPALRRWLSRIWGLRLLTSSGSYTEGRVWLWELIARLWSDRLVVAAKHGLPRIRVDEIHRGNTIRGRLLVPDSAVHLHSGQQILVSRTRNRRIDPNIGGLLIAAFNRLRGELAQVAGEQEWLTDRSWALVKELQAVVSHRLIDEAMRARAPIRYTPITESYRPAVQLSQSIIAGRPSTSSLHGEQQVYGVLLDMAEIWELYLFHLLRDELTDAEVVHTGRSSEAALWLLHGKHADDTLGAMKPDLMLITHDGQRRLILDAKYKLTTPGPGRPQGVQREDLYQMAAYLSAAANDAKTVNGALVYPASDTILAMEKRGPFRFASSDGTLSFLGLDAQVTTGSGLTNAEAAFVESVRSVL